MTARGRDRLVVLAGLAGVTLLAWVHLAAMARDMDAMSLEAASRAVALRPWGARELALVFGMWTVMMVAMMLPSAAPMLLLHAAVARKAASQGQPVAATAVFAAGYLAVWTAFSAVATLAQWALERAALLSPAMVATSPGLGAGILVAAGIYQLTPLKDACLRQCRSPAHFLTRHWRAGRAGALRMGAVHGAFCCGCCWVLMALLFVGGVMNLIWVAAIALFVLLEKAAPGGAGWGRASGGLLALLGVAGLLGWIRL